MSEDINPLAPAEDAEQEQASKIPAWAVKPDAARTGQVSADVEQLPEGEFVEASPELQEGAAAEGAPEAAEYDGARAHHQIPQIWNQGS